MTTEQMNGNNNSKTSTKKWIDIQREKLDRWEINLGLSAFKPPAGKDDALHFLEMTTKDREKLTCEECADVVIILAQYAAYVGRAAQRMESEALLLKDHIVRELGDSVAEQKAYSPEERRTLALSLNDECYELDGERLAASIKAKRLYGYADRIDKVAKAYETLSYSRKRNRQYGD